MSKTLRKPIALLMTLLIVFASAHIFLLSLPQEANASSNHGFHYDVAPHESEEGHTACSVTISELSSARASHRDFSPDQAVCTFDSCATDLLPTLHSGSRAYSQDDIPSDLPLDQKTNLLL